MNAETSPLISQQQREDVAQATDAWVEKASALFNQSFQTIPVTFDLKGRTSGMFCIRHNRQWIRYNPWIFAKYFEESLATTVPHEVAHYVCYQLHGQNHKPHGQEWKHVMRSFAVPADATCKLDIRDIPQKRLKRYPYQCRCSQHQLTSIRHNRIARGLTSYRCPKCQSTLQAIP